MSLSDERPNLTSEERAIGEDFPAFAAWRAFGPLVRTSPDKVTVDDVDGLFFWSVAHAQFVERFGQIERDPRFRRPPEGREDRLAFWSCLEALWDEFRVPPWAAYERLYRGQVIQVREAPIYPIPDSDGNDVALAIEVRSPFWRGREVAVRYASYVDFQRGLTALRLSPRGAVAAGIDITCEEIRAPNSAGRGPDLVALKVVVGLRYGAPDPEEVGRFYDEIVVKQRRLPDLLFNAMARSETEERPSVLVTARTWMVCLLQRQHGYRLSRALDLVCDPGNGFGFDRTDERTHRGHKRRLLRRVPEAEAFLALREGGD
jgi:hypothetical protein